MSQGSLKGQAILQVVALELEDKLDRPGPGLVETLVENLSQDDHCWQRFCSVLKVINLQSLWLLHFVSQSWKEIQLVITCSRMERKQMDTEISMIFKLIESYMVSHSEMRDYKWLLGVEGSTLEPLLPQQPPWPQ